MAAGMRLQLEFESVKCELKEAQPKVFKKKTEMREMELQINFVSRDKQQLEVEGEAAQELEE
jgi:hypothetical protein